jgi:hypothetical protein
MIGKSVTQISNHLNQDLSSKKRKIDEMMTTEYPIEEGASYH